MDKKLKYAVVGCGSFSANHFVGMQSIDEIEIVALVDRHIEKCVEKKMAYKLNNARCYDDHQEMLAKEKIDVVTVVTSDRGHKQATVDALRAGCHVICEKPMSLFVEDCIEMVQAADEAGKHLLVGQVCRYAPGFIKAKELVENGVIGELFYVESEYAHDYKGLEGVDGWRTDKEREPIIGGACHAIDLLRWIAGDPIETTAYSNHKNLVEWPINDTTVAIMKFPNNVLGKIFTSIGCKRDYTMRTVLYGTKGTIIVDNTNPELALYLEEIEGFPFAAGKIKDISEKTVKHFITVDIANHNVTEEHRSMIAAIREGAPIKTTGKEGARTVCVCRAIVESAKTGKTVLINYPI